MTTALPTMGGTSGPYAASTVSCVWNMGGRILNLPADMLDALAREIWSNAPRRPRELHRAQLAVNRVAALESERFGDPAELQVERGRAR